MLKSSADALASGANMLKKFRMAGGPALAAGGAGARRSPWQEADLTIQHPRSQWAAWGVTFGKRQTAAQ